ncbi:hypothetical protein [Actinomadura macrotermitis]|uniref:Uncharacterized protein n=1 Tax=Actinomadura macrotermitis TaxID=2585200 RepID=A0A7K0BR59_9ACTN|nr:hypothetical protein [Actinomadura macrotermitis]MQY03678.1 hypothetical protein [Actinomadura macrotermitis]
MFKRAVATGLIAGTAFMAFGPAAMAGGGPKGHHHGHGDENGDTVQILNIQTCREVSVLDLLHLQGVLGVTKDSGACINASNVKGHTH